MTPAGTAQQAWEGSRGATSTPPESSGKATHYEDEEGPLGTEWKPVDVQQEDELVVTVCALVHTSGGGGVQDWGRVRHNTGSP